MNDTQHHIDKHRINGIVNFMRYATTVIDPEEVLIQSKINNIDNFTESQLSYLLVQAGIQNTNLKELFQKLNKLETVDIRIINSSQEVFDFFMLIAGGLYYAKSIRRLIKKEDIIELRDILTPKGYEFIFKFANQKECLEDYPLFSDFKNHLFAMGHRILNLYLSSFQSMIYHFLASKIELSEPLLNIQNLRISNQYGLNLAVKARDFIIQQSE